MSNGLTGNLYKLHGSIPYIYDTVSGLSVVDCKYSYPQIVQMMLREKTKFCRPDFVWQLFVHILLQNNIHDTFTYGRISWMQQLTCPRRWNNTQQWPVAAVFGHSLAHEYFFFTCFNLGKFQGPLLMQISSTLKILLGGGDLCYSNTARKLWEYLRSPGLLRKE